MLYPGKLVIFENDLKFFLAKDDKELVKAEIGEKVKVDLSRAYVTERQQLDDLPRRQVLKESLPFKNSTNDVHTDKWSFNTTYETGVNHSERKFKNVGISAEFAPCVEVMGISGSFGTFAFSAKGGSETTHTEHEIKSEKGATSMDVSIPPKSTVIMKLVKITKSFKCNVHCIEVIYNPESRVKCTVRKKNDIGGRTENKTYKLKQFLDFGGNHSASANYEWEEAVTDIETVTIQG